MNTAVELIDLGHRFHDDSYLFQGLNVQIKRGVRLAITGPSGCGKSTLLSLIAGWISPTSGEIRKHGINAVQWIPQNPYGVPARAAIDQIAFPMLARGYSLTAAMDDAQSICETLSLGYLTDRRPFSILSGGEGQRFMFARALASEPDLLLIDEPTAQLDRSNASSVNAAIAALADAGVTTLIATHDPDTANACDAQLSLDDQGREAR